MQSHLHEPASLPRPAWDAVALLGGLDASHVTAPARRDELEELLWADLRGEHDAARLDARIRCRADVATVSLGLVLPQWLADEMNHCRGLSRIYHLVTGESEASIAERLAAEPTDDGPLAAWLHDEFRLALLLAYDELVSARGYAADRPLYAGLGPQVLEHFVCRVAADESRHYSTFLGLARSHCSRRGEAERILAEIVELDLATPDYPGLFVFTLRGPLFERQFLESAAERVLRGLR